MSGATEEEIRQRQAREREVELLIARALDPNDSYDGSDAAVRPESEADR